jgi:hypothetical protein
LTRRRERPPWAEVFEKLTQLDPQYQEPISKVLQEIIEIIHGKPCAKP